MNKKIFAFTAVLASIYGAISLAQSTTEHCYFAVDDQIIFDGPCNQEIANIEVDFATEGKSKQITVGDDYFTYLLEI